MLCILQSYNVGINTASFQKIKEKKKPHCMEFPYVEIYRYCGTCESGRLIYKWFNLWKPKSWLSCDFNQIWRKITIQKNLVIGFRTKIQSWNYWNICISLLYLVKKSTNSVLVWCDSNIKLGPEQAPPKFLKCVDL